MFVSNSIVVVVVVVVVIVVIAIVICVSAKHLDAPLPELGEVRGLPVTDAFLLRGEAILVYCAFVALLVCVCLFVAVFRCLLLYCCVCCSPARRSSTAREVHCCKTRQRKHLI